MQLTSPMQVAQDYVYTFETTPEDATFSLLRDAHQQLGHAAKKGAENPLTAVAGVLVADLLGHILEDVTRAVPWDDSEHLKTVRTKVLGIAQTALRYLSMCDPEGLHCTDYFRKMGDLLLQYEAILDSLNENDRRLLWQE